MGAWSARHDDYRLQRLGEGCMAPPAALLIGNSKPPIARRQYADRSQHSAGLFGILPDEVRLPICQPRPSLKNKMKREAGI